MNKRSDTMPTLRRMQPDEVAQLEQVKKNGSGQRKAIEALYDQLLFGFVAGVAGEATLEDDDTKVNVRNRLKAAAARRGLTIKFLRTKDEKLIRFKLEAGEQIAEVEDVPF